MSNYYEQPGVNTVMTPVGVGSKEWQDFWDKDAIVTEYDYGQLQPVPREVQPASYIRLADQPLGAIALRPYIC